MYYRHSAEAADAFLQSVDSHQGVYQPTLEPGWQNTHTHQATVYIVLVAPVWKSQPKYPTLAPTHVGRLPKADNRRCGDNGQQR